jgi:hypothetical protein
MRRLHLRVLPLALLIASPAALAHHGVASLGAAGLEGPGAPIETSSSATLPEGKWLGMVKLDYAKFKTFDPLPPAETDYNAYWMAGVGYGFKPWLSGYAFQPYNVKVDEAGGLNSRGPTDLSLAMVIGFKYDDKFMLVPANESLDDLRDWHFTVNLGMSLPTGDANHRLSDTSIDPGKSLGFGKASFNYGLTATKQFTDNDTMVFEMSQIRFQKFHYDPDPVGGFPAGVTVKFGTETRLNAAISHRLMTNPETKFRLDGNAELNFLNLGRDVEDGVPGTAGGGNMLYGVLGLRFYKGATSVGIAVKKPIWTRLNEEAQQQGSEGKEKYRLVTTFSAMF